MSHVVLGAILKFARFFYFHLMIEHETRERTDTQHMFQSGPISSEQLFCFILSEFFTRISCRQCDILFSLAIARVLV